MISEIKRKRKKPNFIDLDLWERWQRYWNTSEAKKIHETYSKNIMSKAANEVEPSTHTGGTTTHYDHGKLMSLKVIHFQSIFLIFFYLKRLIYVQKYGITNQTVMQQGIQEKEEFLQ